MTTRYMLKNRINMRKSSGLRYDAPKQILPDTNEDEQKIDFPQVELFSSLINDLDSVKTNKELRSFIKNNKSDINSLNSDSKKKFLDIVKEKFFS